LLEAIQLIGALCITKEEERSTYKEVYGQAHMCPSLCFLFTIKENTPING
jgi:hypothetical protein